MEHTKEMPKIGYPKLVGSCTEKLGRSKHNYIGFIHTAVNSCHHVLCDWIKREKKDYFSFPIICKSLF